MDELTEYAVRYVSAAGRELTLGNWRDKSVADDFAKKLRGQGFEPRVMARALSEWWDTGS